MSSEPRMYEDVNSLYPQSHSQMREECKNRWDNKWCGFIHHVKDIHSDREWRNQAEWEEFVDECWDDWEYWRSYCDYSCDGFSCANRMMLWGEHSMEKLNYILTGTHYD